MAYRLGRPGDQDLRAARRIDLVSVAPREWSILELFMRNPNQILSRTHILNRVWSYSYDPGSNVVDVHVGYLRRKITFPGAHRSSKPSDVPATGSTPSS